MVKTIRAGRSFLVTATGCVAALLSACGGGGSTTPVTPASYQVSATAGTGGTISPATTMVNAGGTTTLTVGANSGYAVSSVTGCGGSLSGNTYTTGAVTANCTVAASFVAQYTITLQFGLGGTIKPATQIVNAGSTATFTIATDTGYLIGSVTGCGGSLTTASYTTGPINANCIITAAFTPEFTWFGGSNTPGAASVFGTLGVPAPANIPGARDGGVTWTDSKGNRWLFGGFAGYAHNPSSGDFLNDLWKYSPDTGQWTWVSGSATVGAQGVYGTKGAAAAGNVPGARSNEISWTDANDNLWLFGGGGTDASGGFISYNDLWMFSPSSAQWTWVGGSNSVNTAGVYGTKGVASANNIPGAREINNVVWIDSEGNVWLFGGDGHDSTGSYTRLNDLWKYSPSTGEWTWVSGSTTGNAVSGANTGTAMAVYGTQGVAAAANTPGARLIPMTWTDSKGNMWMFGGVGYDSAGAQGALNDMWEFSPVSQQWTWVGGSNTANPAGVYGTQGVTASTNVPPGRMGAIAWTDPNGNLWMFGGQGYDVPTGFYHRLNDLWKFTLGTNVWTWVAGSTTFDAPGVYGNLGATAASNVPGARASPYMWKDANNNMWMFGGYQYDDPTNTRFEMNDVWMYPTQ